MKKAFLYLFFFNLLLLCGCEASSNNDVFIGELSTADEVEEANEIIVKEELIYVDICGKVNNPGVFQLESGSRVYEAIEMAGGFLDDADVNSINQARTLVDGEKIYVGSVNESISVEDSGLININKATKAELMTLPGIGETKAESIINYRETNGKYSSIEDIKKIEGIKDGVYDKIYQLIVVY